MNGAATPQPRQRNAAATREAILASARQAFAQSGYEGAGVREIAHGAGVTAMLVNRYFGSKEQLFAEVLVEAMKNSSVLLPMLVQGQATGRDIATSLVEITKNDATPLEGFQIMMHSASSKRAAEIGRQHVQSNQHRVIADVLTGANAPERAALLLALIAGLQVMRQTIGLPALADAQPAVLIDLLAPLFEQLISGSHQGHDRPATTSSP